MADEASTRSTEAVAKHLARIADELEGANAALRGTAETATRQSSEALTALFSRLSMELDASGLGLRETIETGARASVSSLSATGDRLRSELAQVLEKLGQTGAALDRVVASASGQLGEIQGDLGDRVLDLQRSLGAIATQVGELDRISGITRADGDKFVDRLASHSTALAEVARELATNQEAIDSALGRRHDSLKTLVADVGAKSGDFERMMRDFSLGVERNFALAQTRAREISEELAAASKGATSATTSQFEEIRENAVRERELTEKGLQQAYEQANTQLSQIMDQATGRFRASVAEVKEMASQMQRELDATRGELKRGVFDLPRETSEAAEAMRRVVGDQIKALKELAAVVAPHGFDLSDPEEDVAPPPPPPPPAPRSNQIEAIVRREPPPPALRLAPEPEDFGPLDITIAAAPVALPPAPAPREEPRAKIAIEPPAPEPARQRPPAPILAATPEAANPRAQSGWLSNLLAAASRDIEDPRPSVRRTGNEGLDSITSDIARLVDGAAAAEVWERWRQGDTGSMTRRLYTAAGQQAFEDIRRRIRSEPAFRESVSRYVQEFERLLAKIGQNDRDGQQSRAAMLSDSGKVYMMLAHAAGRLG